MELIGATVMILDPILPPAADEGHFPKTLWAPWRVEYYRLPRPLPDFIAEAVATSDDKSHLVLKRGKSAFLIVNRYPYAAGHLMAIPYRRVAGMEELSDSERLEIWELAVVAQRALRTALRAEGFNVGANLGTCAGAGFAEHFHLHIVPRWSGDMNFMPILSETRIIGQALADLYDRLKEAL